MERVDVLHCPFWALCNFFYGRLGSHHGKLAFTILEGVEMANNLWWYRLVAWVALVLIGLAGLMGLYLVLSHPLLALAYLLTAMLAAGVGWRLLMGRGHGPVWPWVVVLAALFVALITETWEFLSQGNRLWAVILMIGLAVAGVGLATVVRRRYSQKLQGQPVRSVGGRPFLIINPKSGDGRAIKAVGGASRRYALPLCA
jgi:hypothetical protein